MCTPTLKGIWHRAFCTCVPIWFLIWRNSFQSWYLWENSFSIDVVGRVKIITPILKNCLITYQRFKRHILCFDESYFRPVAVLFRKEKNEWKIGGRTSETLHSGRCAVSWKTIKCFCLYSTDMAFTQHKHDNYSLLTKGQSLRIKRFSKRHLKLQTEFVLAW